MWYYIKKGEDFMPFIRRRIRENFILFLLMGFLYHIIYRSIELPISPYALPISYGGAIVVAMFGYLFLLYTYLLNVGDLRVYFKVNVIAYSLYILFYYIILTIDMNFWRISEWTIFDKIYGMFMMPYSLFEPFGLSRVLSSALVHIIFLLVIGIVPLFIREYYDPLEEYFQSDND